MYYRVCFHIGEMFCMSQWHKGRDALLRNVRALPDAIASSASVEGAESFEDNPIIVEFQLLTDFLAE